MNVSTNATPINTSTFQPGGSCIGTNGQPCAQSLSSWIASPSYFGISNFWWIVIFIIVIIIAILCAYFILKRKRKSA